MTSGSIDSFLLVTQYYPPERGAAQVRLGAVTAELVRRGHRVEVVTALPNYPTGRIFDGWSHRPVQVATEGDIRVVRTWVWASMGSGIGRIVNYLSFGVMSLVGMLRARPADWVIVEYPTLFGALPAVVWCRLRGRRVIVNVADLWVDAIVEIGTLRDGRLVALLRLVERAMLRSADVVNAVTEGVRDELVSKGVDPARLAWLPNGADTSLFAPGEPDPSVREELGLGPDDALVVYAGTHGYVHGLEVVLDAAERLRDRPIRFLLVGGGSEKPRLQELAAERGLSNVTFRDPVPPEEVARLLKSSLCGLATVRAGDLYKSIRSAKMLPTMSSGRPVVYSGDDEGAAIISSTGAGIVTPPGDGVALAAAIEQLVDDPDAGSSMGAAGRAWIETTASWQRLVGDWLEHLAKLKLLNGRPTGDGDLEPFKGQ